MRSTTSLSTLLALALPLLFAPPPLASAQQPPAQRLSPHETKKFEVDGAAITITYGRPSMRGRKVFGGIRPFGVIWMPGADEATIVETSADLQIGNVKLPKGSYSIYTLPGETAWKLIISKETGQWHTVYHPEQDFARFDMKLEQLSQPVEQLTMSAVPSQAGGGVFMIEWETTRASVPFSVVR